MEWIETTGKTVGDAVERALDMLGVDDENLEYDVLSEPKAGFLGMGRSDARIRARVKPISREKPGERRRDKRRSGRRAEVTKAGKAEAPAGPSRGDRPAPARSEGGQGESGGRRRRGRRGGSRSGRTDTATTTTATIATGEKTVTTELSIDDQADVAGSFIAGLLDAFDVDARVDTVIDEDAILVDVEGDDLGLLLGRGGVTLAALEELTRAAVLRRAAGSGARVNVDVCGYRARRREALGEFARGLAEKVRESGTALELEPMSAADRKVVHDTCAEIEGVSTTSEGEDARRRVVILPA